MTSWSVRLVILFVALLAAGCSGSEVAGSADDAATGSCTASAEEVVDRLDTFIAPYVDLSPEEFLATPELEGLDEFQNDVAEIIVRVATDPNDQCTERDLEAQVDVALQQYAGRGLLQQYLVGAVSRGIEVETRDVAVTPDDDLLAILPLLGPGSSITFSEGVFTLDATLLVQSDLVMVGAGRDETIIESTADTAALAVVGGGRVTANDLSIKHVGDVAASVVLSVDASLEFVRVGISGAIVDEDDGGGSGIVLTASDPDSTPTQQAVFDGVVVADNQAAGIAVTGSIAPSVLNSRIESNSQCGLCYFDDAAGQVQGTTFAGNGVGLQASNTSAPEIAGNVFTANVVAGVLLEDESAAVLVDNSFDGLDIVGVDAQGESNPILQRNTFTGHAVAVSLRAQSTASVSDNQIIGGDVGMLVGGSSAPSVFDNEIFDTETAALLHAGSSSGEFLGNTIRPMGGAGVVVEGTASPVHRNVTVDGGLVGAAFREDARGSMTDSVFTGQQVGFETNDNAAPTIESVMIVGATEAGAIVSGMSTTSLIASSFEEPLEIGIQIDGQAEPIIEGNTVTGGDTAMLVTGDARPRIIDNTMIAQSFGIGVSGSAVPTIEENEIVAAAAGAMSFEDDSAGDIRRNTILDAGIVGIRVAGTAQPSFDENMLFAAVRDGTLTGDDGDAETDDNTAADEQADESGSGAGFLFAEQAGGSAEGNQVFGFVIGIQVSDSAAPELVANRVDGAGIGGVGILYGLDGAGTARENTSVNQQLGFQLSGTAAPTLTDNIVENVSAAAFLIQGEAVPALSGNACDAAPAGIVVLEAAVPDLGDNRCPIGQ